MEGLVTSCLSRLLQGLNRGEAVLPPAHGSLTLLAGSVQSVDRAECRGLCARGLNLLRPLDCIGGELHRAECRGGVLLVQGIGHGDAVLPPAHGCSPAKRSLC